ncbi:hypothetical protein CYMTET_50709 [Cymbomonas tetramitiformis]|uniref:Uncharacterized protein n=1 Tax=Cymbomonas tetramitiformis TaxID=36881 RepID=A0AAE0BP81_9CHLO|nr:hypothetical protein CYMTET_50709 [Cymbomonas tetramitiformis]
MAGGELTRRVPAAYSYGTSDITGNGTLSGARKISCSLKLYEEFQSTRRGTSLSTYLGQFFSHDISRSDAEGCGHGLPGEEAPIPVPVCDEWFDADCLGNLTLPFTRSAYSNRTEEGARREQLSCVTAFLDGSAVYGSEYERARALRYFRDGKFRMSQDDLLPLHTYLLPLTQPPASLDTAALACTPPGAHVASEVKGRSAGAFVNEAETDERLFEAGDVRANVNPGVLALHTLFVRNHNRFAREIKQENPGWSDSQLFTEARRWNIAQMQAVFFYEYVPSLGLTLDAYTEYNPEVDASIDNFFSTVAFRYGHSEVSEVYRRVDDAGVEILSGHLLLFNTYYSPSRAMSEGIDPLLRGLATSQKHEVDVHFSAAVHHYLNNHNGLGGEDLLARSIQRGRDHGIPDYNSCREALGLGRFRAFEQITAREYLVAQLKEAYNNDINSVDAIVGGLAEDHVYGSDLGELFYHSLKDQFTRLRDGDRLFFESAGAFTSEQLTSLWSTRIRDLIFLNTEVHCLPQNVLMQGDGDPWATATCRDGSRVTPQPPPPEPPLEEDSDVDEVFRTTELVGEDQYQLTWRSKTGADGVLEAHISLRVKAAGWVGFGVEGPGGMQEADIVMGYVDDEGIAWARDYYGVGPGVAPELDSAIGGTEDLRNVAGAFVDGFTILNFTKKFHTGDPFDLDINAQDATPVIFSWNSADSVDTSQYHGNTARGKSSVAFHLLAEDPPPIPPPPSIPDSPPALTGNEPLSPPPSEPVSGLKSVELVNGFTLEWELGESGEDIMIRMIVATTGWVGLGIEPDDGGMSNCDMIMGHVENGVASVTDAWADGYATPSADTDQGGTDDIISFSGELNGGFTTIEFVRKLVSADGKDKNIEDRVQSISFAWGDTAEWGYHGTKKGKAEVNLMSADDPSVTVGATGPVPMIKNHGVIMATTWAGLSVIGVFIARYLRGWSYWLKAHRYIQSLVSFMAFIGEIIGFSYTKGEFRTTHSLTAIVVVFLTFPQLTLGTLAVKRNKNVTVRQIHRVMGYSLVAIALWQCLTGMQVYGVAIRFIQLYYSWLLALVAGFVLSTDQITKLQVNSLTKTLSTTQNKVERMLTAVDLKGFTELVDVDDEETGNQVGGEQQTHTPPKQATPSNTLKKDSKFRPKNNGVGRYNDSYDGGDLRSVGSVDKFKGGISDRLSDDSRSQTNSMSQSQTQSQANSKNTIDTTNLPIMSIQSFVKLCKQGKHYTIIDEYVVDFDKFFGRHPGGDDYLTEVIAKDGTARFNEFHSGRRGIYQKMLKLSVGRIDTKSVDNPLLSLQDSIESLVNARSRASSGITPVSSSEDMQSQELQKSASAEQLAQMNEDQGWFKMKLVSFREEAANVRRLYFAVPPGEPPLDVDCAVPVHLSIRFWLDGNEDDEADYESRAYTPVCMWNETSVTLLIKKYPDGKITPLIFNVRPGSLVEMKGPKQMSSATKFQYNVNKYRTLVMIAGGTGITPMTQMIDFSMSRPEDTTMLSLIFCVSTVDDLMLTNDFHNMMRSCPRVQVSVIVSKPPPGWQGLSGRLTVELLQTLLPPSEEFKAGCAFAVMCGPKGFTDALAGKLDPHTKTKSVGTLNSVGLDDTHYKVMEG